MNTVIVTGGNIRPNFLKKYLEENKFNTIIASDKGLEALYKIKIEPTYIIGDFDSVDKQILNKYKNANITYLKPEKDFTDTHMALKLALNIKSTTVTILAGTGTRIDHTLANIHILKEALEKNIDAKIVDEHNEIMLLNKDKEFNRNNYYKYISLIPLTTKIEGVSLEGLKYSLQNAMLKIGESIGVSNEQIDDKTLIKIKSGIAIVIFSKD